jgi:signal peptidase
MAYKFLKIIKNAIGAILILFLIIVAFTFLPIPGNFKVFTVQSGSMEPAIRMGSLIFVMPKDDYGMGNIVTRKTNDPKVTVTHRIIAETQENGEKVYTTKGDANNAEDPGKITASQIIGKMIWGLPLVGYPIGYARTTPGFILLVVVPAVIIIYDEFHKIKREIGKKKNKKPEEPEGEALIGAVSFSEKGAFVRPSRENPPQPDVPQRRRRIV